jgi:hypothetical protein
MIKPSYHTIEIHIRTTISHIGTTEESTTEENSGYQRIERLHAKSKIPIKNPKGNKLLELEKAYN